MTSLARLAIAPLLFLVAAAQESHAASFAYITEAQASTVSVIETATRQIVARIPVGRYPYSVAAHPAGVRVYVTNYGDGTVSAIDTTAKRVIATIAVPAYPTVAAVNPSGTRLYVAHAGDYRDETGTVSVIDTDSHAVVGRIPVTVGAEWLAMSADGTRLYVSSWSTGIISVIDTAAQRVLMDILLGSPVASVAIDAQGQRIYATLYAPFPQKSSVLVLDASSHALIRAIPVGEGASAIALNPSGTRAYVANSGDGDYTFGDTVSVIDTASLAVVAIVKVGQSPRGIVVDPSGTHVYVTNGDISTVSVVDAATHALVDTIAVGRQPISRGNFMGPANAALAVDNYQGLWWNASEPGWGVNIAQQGNILFATWFTYDVDGSGQWIVMSNGKATGLGTYSGTLYKTTGPSFDAVPWNPAAVRMTPVGTATFEFTGADSGYFTYMLEASTQVKAITRLGFSSPIPTCTTGGAAGDTANYQDLWWRSPAGSGSGWGVNIAHQGETLFATWFTYDENGKGQWLVMSNGERTGRDTWSGTLYRTRGPFLLRPWSAVPVVNTAVGSATFTFTDARNATFAYALDGRSGSEPITRLVYSSPETVCK